MKQQSSIEWFVEELNNWRIKHFGENSIIGIPDEVFNKAKQMHKQEIEDAYIDGHSTWGNSISAEQYYKNTYEK